ncbi:MAG: rod shape-determining protein MreC [Pseudomonadales bacterium]
MASINKPLFRKSSSLAARAVILCVLSFALILADYQFAQMKNVRAVMGMAAMPFYWLSNIPARMSEWTDETWQSRKELIKENAQLRSESRVLAGRVQKMATLSAENGRLRNLLNSFSLLESDDVVIAELIGVSPRIDQHIIILDKGSNDGVYVGQPVLDAKGIMGQVVETNPFTSRVLLLSDERHALPVQVNRSGYRAVVEGVGSFSELRLTQVALTTDIQVGDLLVSSGLGQRFPAGYPVATVTHIVRDAGQAFLLVTAEPTAEITRSRHLLLVFPANEPEAELVNDE